MSELKLLPCPFCGGEAKVIEDSMLICGHRYWRIIHNSNDCPITDAFGIFRSSAKYSTAEKAIAAWNRRAQPENSRQHALQTGVCPMCEDCPDGCPVETPNDSRNRPENDPLTLDELRQMDGEPVWVQELPPYTTAGYKVLAAPAVNEYGDICFDGGDCYAPYDYGKTWLAFRSKPKEEV